MVVTALLIPGLRITSIFGALATVVAIALVNSKVWDAALFFSVPDHLSTQVLFLFLANGLIFWVLVKLLPGIEVSGILPALIAPIVFTVSSLLISKYLAHVDWIEVGKIALNYITQAKEYVASLSSPTPIAGTPISRGVSS